MLLTIPESFFYHALPIGVALRTSRIRIAGLPTLNVFVVCHENLQIATARKRLAYSLPNLFQCPP